MTKSAARVFSDVKWAQWLYRACVFSIYAATSVYSFFHGLFIHRALVLACIYPLCGKMKAAAAFVFASLAANTLLEITKMCKSGFLYAAIYYMGNTRYPEEENGKCAFSGGFLYELASKIAYAYDTTSVSAESTGSAQEIMDVFWIC
eukprot:jgi/Antlo1/409/897